MNRILDGDYKHPANPAERREVIRRWVAGGKPAAQLARLTGWKTERYFHVSDLFDEQEQTA